MKGKLSLIFPANITKRLGQVINGAAFIILLHILHYLHSKGFNYIIHSYFPTFITEPSTYYVVMTFNRSIVILISIVSLILFLHYCKNRPGKIILFILSAFTLYVTFQECRGIWQFYTFHYCNASAYEITHQRLFLMSTTLLVLIYSIFPVCKISQKYSKDKIIITVVIFLLYLYLYSFFKAWYFKFLL